MSEMEDGSFLTEYRAALHEAARLGAQEKNAEEERKRTISGLIAASDEPVARSEHKARSHRDVQAIDDQLAEVRLKAAAAGAEAKYMETRYEVWRTRTASWRAKQGAR